MNLLLRYLKNYKGLTALNFLAIFSFALVELGIPTIMAQIIDRGIAKGDTDFIKQMGVVLLVIAIIGTLGVVLLGYCGARISTGIARDIRNDLFLRMEGFSHGEYHQFGISSLINRTTNDVYQLQQFVNLLLRTAMLAPVMFAVSILMTMKASFSLSLIICGTVPIIIICVLIIATLSNPISEIQQKTLDLLNRISRENLTGLKVIRAFRNDSYEKQRFEETNEKYAKTSKKLFQLMGAAQPGFFFLLNMAMLVVFWFSSLKINQGELTVGHLAAFLEYLFHAMFSMLLFSFVFIMYPRARVSAARIEEVLQTFPSVTEPEQPQTAEALRASVKFDHVTFAYPEGEEAILEDISFEGSPGQTIAFIGSTGSGKSTLIHLIPRFYDVTKGKILVDGVDVRQYSLKELRSKIGFIPQKALLFTGSIEENIKFGKNNAHPEEVEHSAKVAQAYEFITQKPNQFQEMVTEGGNNMSGGQKQRLSIARAVVTKPEIYIFDDSFSALDFKTDAALRAKLKKETQDSLVFIVAQRISSISHADQIIVLNEGRIVGRGTHKELLEQCSIYREIASSQMTEEEWEK